MSARSLEGITFTEIAREHRTAALHLPQRWRWWSSEKLRGFTIGQELEEQTLNRRLGELLLRWVAVEEPNEPGTGEAVGVRRRVSGRELAENLPKRRRFGLAWTRFGQRFCSSSSWTRLRNVQKVVLNGDRSLPLSSAVRWPAIA